MPLFHKAKRICCISLTDFQTFRKASANSMVHDNIMRAASENLKEDAVQKLNPR